MRKSLTKLAGLIADPNLDTFTVPSVKSLSGEYVSQFNKALSELRRRAVWRAVRGGVISTEITHTWRGWHVHSHALNDRPWLAQWPMTDIEIVDGKVRKVKSHRGLAREWTAVCQRFPLLRSPRADFDIDRPEHWYFVDLRRADRGAIAEVAKYIVKGDQLLASPGLVVNYLMAVKGQRMIRVFGTLHGVKVDSRAGAIEDVQQRYDDKGELVDVVEDAFDALERADAVADGDHRCPYPNCPDPERQDWEHIGDGYPAEVLSGAAVLVRGVASKGLMVVPLGASP